MTERAFVNARLLLPEGVHDGLTLLVRGGRIADIAADPSVSGIEQVNCEGAVLAPGFFDLQVNGGGGVLFNDAPEVDALAAIAAAHRFRGTTAILPTLISAELEVVSRGIAAVEQAIARGVPGIAGIHIEGPFLNPARRGIHDARKLRSLDADGIAAVGALRGGKTLVTLAPEIVDARAIAELVSRGVVVAAGHSEATFAEMQRAFDAGVTAVTHLFNAMSQITPREPGVVGAALAHPKCWLPMIVDGIHVDPVVLRLALAVAGGADRAILVSDAMPCVGANSQAFELGGRRIEVHDGACRDDTGTLAGADLDLGRAVCNAIKMLDLSLGQAIQAASANPAAMMRVTGTLGSLKLGARADLVLLGNDGDVRRVWVGGDE